MSKINRQLCIILQLSSDTDLGTTGNKTQSIPPSSRSFLPSFRLSFDTHLLYELFSRDLECK